MINASIHALRLENMKNVEILLPEKFGLYAIQQTNGSRFFSYILLYLLNTGSLSKIISMVHEKRGSAFLNEKLFCIHKSKYYKCLQI